MIPQKRREQYSNTRIGCFITELGDYISPRKAKEWPVPSCGHDGLLKWVKDIVAPLSRRNASVVVAVQCASAGKAKCAFVFVVREKHTRQSIGSFFFLVFLSFWDRELRFPTITLTLTQLPKAR